MQELNLLNSNSNYLDKVRLNSRLPQTVIVFKLFSGKTPAKIFKLLGACKGTNNLPWDLLGVKTRIDYKFDHQEVDVSN